jgi:hypothetical protein
MAMSNPNDSCAGDGDRLTHRVAKDCEKTIQSHLKAVENGHFTPWGSIADIIYDLWNRRVPEQEDEPEMIKWRSLAQEMTPGGSEFMSVESVRSYYRELKDDAHRCKIENVKLKRLVAEQQPDLEEMREALEKLDELATKSIKDPTSGKALWSWDVRDIVRAALYEQGKE